MDGNSESPPHQKRGRDCAGRQASTGRVPHLLPTGSAPKLCPLREKAYRGIPAKSAIPSPNRSPAPGTDLREVMCPVWLLLACAVQQGALCLALSLSLIVLAVGHRQSVTRHLSYCCAGRVSSEGRTGSSIRQRQPANQTQQLSRKKRKKKQLMMVMIPQRLRLPALSL
jgi:hypothetical protein